MEKRWVFHHPDPEKSKIWGGELKISPLITQILINRGINSPQEARHFLHPSLSDLHDPSLLKDMTKGVERLASAVENREKITIFGDYDVDGTTSTSLLLLFFGEIGADCNYYIPERLKEGYGLNEEAVRKLASEGTKVLITVDNGISSFKEVALASELGLDVIITDHHQIPDNTPPAYAVINPQQTDCHYPYKDLAGVGIVFNLIIALRSLLRANGFWRSKGEPNIKKYLDLVALGTIADIAPLTGVNRVFTVYGLTELSRGDRPGIGALKKVSGLDSGEVNVGGVGFQLGPRLNAAGRMSRADAGVRLLTTKDIEEAHFMAEELDLENKKRQALEKEMLEEAITMVEEMKLHDKASIVVHSCDWHPGVIGIVASRLVDKYYRPALVIALTEGVGKGSARSIDGFHLYRGLSSCSKHLMGFGGHKYAAGITIAAKDIDAFSADFDDIVKASVSEEDFRPPLKIDGSLSFTEISESLMEETERLAPFGASNAEPVFVSESVNVLAVKTLKEAHLKITLSQEGISLDAIAFNMVHKNIKTGDMLSIAYSLRFNVWNNRRSIQLIIRDIK